MEQQELNIRLKLAKIEGERKVYLEENGWEGMTNEEVTWLYNYCNGDFRSKFMYKPTLEYIRELMAADKNNKICNNL